MNKLQHLYHSAPRHRSPAELDRRVLRDAIAHGQRRKASRFPLLGWLPLAASGAIACLALVLVLKPASHLTNPEAPDTADLSSGAEHKFQPATAIVDSTQPAQRHPTADTLAPPTIAGGDTLAASVAEPQTVTGDEPPTASVTRSASKEAIERQDADADADADAARLDNTNVDATEIVDVDLGADADVAQLELAAKNMTELANVEMDADPSPAKTAVNQRPAVADPSSDTASKQNPLPTTTKAEVTIQISEQQSREVTLETLTPSATSSTSLPNGNSASAPLVPSNSEQLAETTLPTQITQLDLSAVPSNPELNTVPGNLTQTSNDTLRWLRNLRPNDYVIQLDFSVDAAELQRRVGEAAIDQELVHLVNINLPTKTGFAALYGAYDNAQQAYIAVRTLAQDAPNFKPWVRQIDRVLAQVRNAP